MPKPRLIQNSPKKTTNTVSVFITFIATNKADICYKMKHKERMKQLIPYHGLRILQTDHLLVQMFNSMTYILLKVNGRCCQSLGPTNLSFSFFLYQYQNCQTQLLSMTRSWTKYFLIIFHFSCHHPSNCSKFK